MSPSTKAIDDSPDPMIGKTLGGKYTLRRVIGRGGVGLVYLAERADGDRDAVVKVLAPQWASDDEALARFEREAARLNGLRHPNIVSMLDFGRDGRDAYLAMEYLQGELLSEYVDRNRYLTLEQFVPIAAQILKGIGHAHSREMMIRDIKPANVMLCERKGRANFVKILDFGLAKLVKGDMAITEDHVMGTVGYLSPEQIKGDPLDLRVDVYALGIMFYYMLAGRAPFAGDDNAAVFYKTVNEPPPDLAETAPHGEDLPKGLVKLIHRCLAKNRDDRPSDADEIVEGLIDVVPAAMFRLPRAETAAHGIPKLPAGYGNTGMMELLGDERSPSARIDAAQSTPRPGDLVAVTTPLPAAETEPSAADLDAGPDDFADDADRGRSMFGALAIGVLLAAVAGGIAAYVFSGQNETSTPPTAAVTTDKPPPGPDLAAVASELADAEALLDAGKLDEAGDILDAVRTDAASDTKLQARLLRAEGRLKTARLLAVAKKFEDDGNEKAALAAYRDVIEHDIGNAPAREAIVRLSGEAAPPPPDAKPATLSITSEPTAEVFIDGKSAGKTPYSGEVPAGTHAVKLTARRHHPWETTVEIDGEAQTLEVELDSTRKPKRNTSSSSSSSSSSSPSATPPPDPTPKPDPTPPPDPEPPKTSKKKASPFLPTKKDDKSSVFLPTKKNE